MKISRRNFLVKSTAASLCGSLASSLWLNGCSRFGKAKKPNVLLIVLDTARADKFGFMGYNRPTSPFIDSIASQGAVYKNAFAPCFWTLPSHASIFTGLYPCQAGATSETNMLPPGNITQAELLKDAGYRTVGASCNSWVSIERGFSSGFMDYFEIWRNIFKEQYGKPAPLETVATEKMKSWLMARQGDSAPFFMFVNLNAPHLPYTPPNPFLTDFAKHYTGLEQLNRLASIKGMWEFLAGKIQLSENDYQVLHSLYDGEIAYADNCVKEIITALRETGDYENTMIIITSDHGENIGEHGLIDHLLSMYDTTLHVPLVIKYPADIPAPPSQHISGMVSLIDIFPTVARICGCKIPGHTDTLIKRKSLVSPDTPPSEYIYAENDRPLNGIGLMKSRYPEFDVSSIDYSMRAIRDRTGKFIWKVNRDKEFYDLAADPHELKNIYTDQLGASKYLFNRLRLQVSKLPAPKTGRLFQSTDEESLEQLRSLGYIK